MKRLRFEGMLGVLLLLCAWYSYRTWHEQSPTGADAALQVVAQARRTLQAGAPVLIVGEDGDEARSFCVTAALRCKAAGLRVMGNLNGEPPALAAELDRLSGTAQQPEALLVTREVAGWRLLQVLAERRPAYAQARVLSPRSYMWPDFLRRGNLLAVADRIVVIAIVAIGMTMVIITGGIDLSVGSLIALSAVVWTILIQNHGGKGASVPLVLFAAVLAVLMCGLVGLTTGLFVTRAKLPPFIVTLTMMMVASGLAFILSKGQSVYEVPPWIDRLGRGTGMFGLPHTIAVMVLLYAVAHVVMTRTTWGRQVYAVGGNDEAARLSGVAVGRVTVLAYVICGLLAGLGGIVQASQLQSGAPTYGNMYELYVIAAVVVGGTSLSGGAGKILGTLTGAFIIAVIQNGMNLTGVESYTQKVVLGVVILLAVLLDTWRRKKA